MPSLIITFAAFCRSQLRGRAELCSSAVGRTRCHQMRTRQNRAPLPLLPAPAQCPRLSRWVPLRTRAAPSARRPAAEKAAGAPAPTASALAASRTGPAAEPSARAAASRSTTRSHGRAPGARSGTTAPRPAEMSAEQRGGAFGIPPARAAAAVTVRAGQDVRSSGAGGERRGGRREPTEGLGAAGAASPQDGGGREGLCMLLQGLSRMSWQLPGAAGAAGEHLGAPPGGGTQQGAEQGAGPAGTGTELGADSAAVPGAGLRSSLPGRDRSSQKADEGPTAAGG